MSGVEHGVALVGHASQLIEAAGRGKASKLADPIRSHDTRAAVKAVRGAGFEQ